MGSRSISASEVKTHLLSLLDDVERGETLVITRHGKPIARIVPDEDEQQKRTSAAIDRLEELRKHTKPVSVDELIAWKHEGHRY